MASFVIAHNIGKVEANSREKSLIGEIDDDDIITAVNEYGGQLKAVIKSYRPSC